MGRIIKVLLIVLIISISTATGVLIHEVRELKKAVQNQQEVLGIYNNIIQRHNIILESLVEHINSRFTENNYGQGMRTTQRT
jgi:ABC-type polysaccharide/polyol phosphate export permease